MINLHRASLFALAMVVSASAIAKETSITPTTTTPIIPALSSDPQTLDVVTIDGIQSTGSNSYVFIYMDPKKISQSQVAKELATVNNQLAGLNSASPISACKVSFDFNSSGMNCGNGLMQFNTYDFYTYKQSFNLQSLPIRFNAGVKEVLGANFVTPTASFIGDNAGRVVHIHFGVPVSQFLIHVDSGQAAAPSVGNIQFTVSNGALDVLPGSVGYVAPTDVADSNVVTLTAPTQFVGVQRDQGFTDVRITASGGQSQAFVADLFSVVTSTNFNHLAP